jgi:hypothetical protein
MQKLHQLILKKKWHHPITERERQHNETDPSTTVPRAIDFEEVVEDTDMDTGSNEKNATSSGNSMCSDASF